MPKSAQRACNWPGCPNTTRRGSYCDEHRIKRQRAEARDDPGSKFYCSAVWKRFRKWFLARHPLCDDCLAKQKLVPAREVHHRIRRKERPDLSLVESNCQGLCKSCHSKRTMRERTGGGSKSLQLLTQNTRVPYVLIGAKLGKEGFDARPKTETYRH